MTLPSSREYQCKGVKSSDRFLSIADANYCNYWFPDIFYIRQMMVPNALHAKTYRALGTVLLLSAQIDY